MPRCLSNAAEGILAVAEDGYISFANPAIAGMLPPASRTLQGTPLLSHRRRRRCPTAGTNRTSIATGAVVRPIACIEAQLHTANGTPAGAAVSSSPPRQQRSMVVIALDMSVVRNLHTQLETQAVTDRSPGCSIAAASIRRWSRAGAGRLRTASGWPSSISTWTASSASMTPSATTRAMKSSARWRLLETCARPYDIIARMGGDEFTALLDSLDHPEDAARVAEKLIELTLCDKDRRHRGDLGASIGIAHFPDCGVSVDQLLRSADMAMYEAKRAGRRQYRFFPAT